MSYNKRDWVQVTVPLKPAEHTEIKARAEQEDRSMANYIRSKLLTSIPRQKGEKK
jgi:hypothetical protein